MIDLETRKLLKAVRRYVYDEKCWLENSYCCLPNGEPDLATMDEAGKPLWRRQQRLLRRIDKALDTDE